MLLTGSLINSNFIFFKTKHNKKKNQQNGNFNEAVKY